MVYQDEYSEDTQIYSVQQDPDLHFRSLVFFSDPMHLPEI